VSLIGRNHNLIGQLLKGFEDGGTEKETKRKRKKYSVKRIVDEQEYSKSIKEWGW